MITLTTENGERWRVIPAFPSHGPLAGKEAYMIQREMVGCPEFWIEQPCGGSCIHETVIECMTAIAERPQMTALNIMQGSEHGVPE